MKKSILLFYTFIQLVVLNAQNTGTYRQISEKKQICITNFHFRLMKLL